MPLYLISPNKIQGDIDNNLNINKAQTLFPDPLSPTIPSVSFFRILKLIPFTAFNILLLINIKMES